MTEGRAHNPAAWLNESAGGMNRYRMTAAQISEGEQPGSAAAEPGAQDHRGKRKLVDGGAFWDWKRRRG